MDTQITHRPSTERIDLEVRATIARASSSVSMVSTILAATDWALHLAASPGKRADLFRLGLEQAAQLARNAATLGGADAQPGVQEDHPAVLDRRFAAA